MAQTGTALSVGQEMPVFELPDDEGRPFNLPEHMLLVSPGEAIFQGAASVI